MIDVILILDDAAAVNLIRRLTSGDIAYATANAMNKTMDQAQIDVRTKAFARVFTERNKSLAKALTTIPTKERATKRKLSVRMMNVQDARTGRLAGEGFVERQIAGAGKTAKNSVIAIPVLGRGLRRNSGGSIPKNLKPRGNAKLFRIGNRLVERQKNRKELITRYILQKNAKASSRGRFDYLDVGVTSIKSNITRNWTLAIRSVIGRASLSGRGMGMPKRGALRKI